MVRGVLHKDTRVWGRDGGEVWVPYWLRVSTVDSKIALRKLALSELALRKLLGALSTFQVYPGVEWSVLEWSVLQTPSTNIEQQTRLGVTGDIVSIDGALMQCLMHAEAWHAPWAAA
jgi:hypothetical protein